MCVLCSKERGVSRAIDQGLGWIASATLIFLIVSPAPSFRSR